MPAVVLFCLFYGVALQYVPEKTSLLAVLEGIRLASLKLWNGVVHFAPLAVFALFADLAGTIRPRAMTEVGLFLVLFFAGALILTFWIVPGCIAAFTPFKHKEVLQDLKSALLIVVATTLSVSSFTVYFFCHTALGPCLGNRGSRVWGDCSHEYCSCLSAGPTRKFLCLSFYNFCAVP